MIIAATSDVHLPKNYREFVYAVDKMMKRPDVFLVVGDVVDRGDVSEFDKFYNVVFGKFSCPIYMCFGNGEFMSIHEELKSKYRDIKFLEERADVFTVDGKSVGIFGTMGGLDTPTPWQAANIPDIESVYRRRLEEADRSLKEMKTDVKILMTHYAPTFKTLEGENPSFFPSMGSQAYESVIASRRPSIVVHGHSHRGLKQSWIDTVPVFNVSFPLNNEIVIIDTDKLKPGLARFV